jgi:hypothetical protein
MRAFGDGLLCTWLLTGAIITQHRELLLTWLVLNSFRCFPGLRFSNSIRFDCRIGTV